MALWGVRQGEEGRGVQGKEGGWTYMACKGTPGMPGSP